MSNIYSQWLSSILDTENPQVKPILASLSQYRSPSCPPTLQRCYNYARNWCQLAAFLWQNRDAQLYSEKIEMFFFVKETGQSTDVYWFEVAVACDELCELTLIELIHVLQLKQPNQLAQNGILLERRIRDHALTIIKEAVGVCNFVFAVARINCIYLSDASPKLMASISKRYLSFRLIGCWLAGLHELCEKKDYTTSYRWMDTAWFFSTSGPIVSAAQSVAASIPLMQSYIQAMLAMSENQPGVAKAHVQGFLKATGAENAILSQRLRELVQPYPSTPVPQAGSSLLTPPSHERFVSALEKGTSPLAVSCVFGRAALGGSVVSGTS